MHQALDLRGRHDEGELSRHGLAVCRGRLHNQLLDAIYPSQTNDANDCFAQRLWEHHTDLFNSNKRKKKDRETIVGSPSQSDALEAPRGKRGPVRLGSLDLHY